MAHSEIEQSLPVQPGQQSHPFVILLQIPFPLQGSSVDVEIGVPKIPTVVPESLVSVSVMIISQEGPSQAPGGMVVDSDSEIITVVGVETRSVVMLLTPVETVSGISVSGITVDVRSVVLVEVGVETRSVVTVEALDVAVPVTIEVDTGNENS